MIYNVAVIPFLVPLVSAFSFLVVLYWRIHIMHCGKFENFHFFFFQVITFRFFISLYSMGPASCNLHYGLTTFIFSLQLESFHVIHPQALVWSFCSLIWLINEIVKVKLANLVPIVLRKLEFSFYGL